MKNKNWTDDEIQLFMHCVSQFGRDFNKIAEFVKTRDKKQIYQKCRNFKKKMKDILD